MREQTLQLLPGLRSADYVLHPMQSALSSGADSLHGPNIGEQGRNLTISFLSCNRSGLSLKLLCSLEEHLPLFQGEVLIVDNGSAPQELARVREAATASPLRVRLLELGKNYGVAGGRNRGIDASTTDWVLCLDNDIYLIANPLPAIQRDIALLGCHYLNLPLLQPDRKTIFALGGQLHISRGEDGVLLGGGPASTEAQGGGEGSPFLSTFLFGGASVLKRKSFLAAGGYDEGMFVGFEDTEFSLRLFREGMKIGNTRVLAAVHDHPAPTSRADTEYERRRFAREALRNSADYFSSKHGIQTWAEGVDAWLSERRRELGLGRGERLDTPSAGARRPRIALVVDVDGWAFSNIATQLSRHLSELFEFRIISMAELDNYMELLLATEDCDLVHFFWREHLQSLTPQYLLPYAARLSPHPEALVERLLTSRPFTTSVYDHLFLGRDEVEQRRGIFSRVRAYSVCSRRLDVIYRQLPAYSCPAAVLEDGVDTDMFQPQRLERFRTAAARPLVVGWAGNSRWAGGRADYKGVETVLKPALRELQEEGYAVVANFADRAVRHVPHAQMPDYYAQIDVLVCTSKIEGTPNPVLEAMACGVPIISTDVGIVRDALGPQQQELILNERTVSCLKERLAFLLSHPEMLSVLSAENLRYVKAWDWSKKARGFAAFFESALGRVLQAAV